MLWVLTRSATEPGFVYFSTLFSNIYCGYSLDASHPDFLISPQKTYIVGTHQMCITKKLLKSTHYICFYGKLRKISKVEKKSAFTGAMELKS